MFCNHVTGKKKKCLEFEIADYIIMVLCTEI